MIVGVFSKDLGSIMAESLSILGVKRAWVVCGAVGLDEVSARACLLNALILCWLVCRFHQKVQHTFGIWQKMGQ